MRDIDHYPPGADTPDAPWNYDERLDDDTPDEDDYYEDIPDTQDEIAARERDEDAADIAAAAFERKLELEREGNQIGRYEP